jgi:hypothetical protein
MANICKLCARPDQDVVRAAFASGATDRELAQQFGVSHMAIGRHRRAHIVGPLKAAVAALDKGRTELEQRTQQLAAIEQGDPVAVVAAMFGAAAQARKLQRVEERLERVAAKAETDEAPQHVATLSAQQLRSIETGARLAGHPSFTPRAGDGGGGGDGQKFSITINLGPERTVSISATPIPRCQAETTESAVAEESEDRA